MNTTHMVDVGDKADTRREAVAEGFIGMKSETALMVRDSMLPKGNAIETARVAAIMAAKNTPQLIPLCHPLMIVGAECEFECDVDAGRVRVETTVRCMGKTGVEMEALSAACAALLTIYDMTKGVDETLEIEAVRLLKKTGGKSGDFVRPGSKVRQ